MTGYRRIEPAFCRGCGVPWTPGADACPACGETIAREGVAGGDPYAARKLRVGLLTTIAVVGIAWSIPLLGYDDVTAWLGGWTTTLACVVGLGLVVARFAFPGGLAPIFAVPRRKAAWAEALAVGLVVGVGLAFVVDVTNAALVVPGSTATAVTVFVALVVFEELLFRGVLFEAVEAFGGKWNAVIASSLLFGLMRLSPPVVVLGLVASLVRLRTGSAWAGVVLRLVAAGVVSWAW